MLTIILHEVAKAIGEEAAWVMVCKLCDLA